MKQFAVGRHKTKGGYEAIVLKLRQRGPDWVLVGALKCPVTDVLHVNYWTLAGVSIGKEEEKFCLANAEQVS